MTTTTAPASKPARPAGGRGSLLPPWFGRFAAVALAVLAILLPFTHPSSTFLGDCIIAGAYVVMALGLNVVVGFAGLLDLGYVAFYAIGAFTVGWFSSSFYANANIHILVSGQAAKLPGIHVNFLLVLVIAALLCAIAGVLIGLPTLRLRGDYIAIVTLAFGEIIHVFAINGDAIKVFGAGYPLTNGRQGISPVDQIKLPFIAQFNQLELKPWYWLVLGLAFLVLFIVIRLRDSRLGRAWVAIREDEVAAASMGVPLVKTKLFAYAAGAAIGGMSGAFLAAYFNTVNADQFAFSFSIFVLAMVILGGMGSVWGVVLGAITLTFINYWLIPDVLNGVPGKLHLNFQLSDLGFGIFGFLLVFVMLMRPEGLLPERRHQLELHEDVEVEDVLWEEEHR
ncbi:MAG TPA: branched-chain amino acid ABC transporter permease [Solirubrobacteraceae bacterium]|nr:branched-chain amino acid ABC transporter permease [Solirubrobacteraceae bacterium]